ncbi:MAG: hypothetical protein RIS54_661 [Verrucomicrobiota bacterium]|jgi:hypothetical protein
MDDQDTKENPSSDFNKLDLTQLQGFSFGTQWTQDKSSPGERREGGERPRREERRDGPGGPKRDRRGFRKPAPAPGAAGEEEREMRPRGPGRDGPRGPRRDFRGGPRGDNRGDPRGEGRPSFQDRAPYDSPHFAAIFYPEDTSFNALAKTIRSSYRTIELFEIARTVVAKNDRFIVVLARKPGAEGAARQPIYLSLPDGMPFESEDAVINHVVAQHIGQFFDTAEVEVEAPKGNFQVINKCGVTGELLGPPNYHRYSQIVQQHFDAKIQRMSEEAFRGRIESVREPEAVAQWLEKMKKVTRYTWKSATPAAPAPAPAAPVEAAAPAEGEAPAETPAETAATAEPSEPVVAFDNLEDARVHLLTHAREKLYKTVESARFHGRLIDTMPAGEIRRAVEGALERQRRFPLDTANGLRGRLRREHFTIFKKGSKGISYVCAVKRKFRTPGQTFAESIDALITFIETHPMVKVSELPAKFLQVVLPAAPAAPAEGEAPAPAPEIPVEVREKLGRMQGDLRWLVMEGYVTEFIDGRLFAAPPMPESRKRDSDQDEHDPENYPDAPAEETATAPAAAVDEAAAVETPTEAPTAEAESPDDEAKRQAAEDDAVPHTD